MPGVTGLLFSIREEKIRDREVVRGVNAAAFGGEDEGDLVQHLYDDGDVLFGLVAEIEGQIVGHILFSRLPIETEQGSVVVAALAPLAVLPEWQRLRIGAALVREEMTRCRERRVPAVVVLGEPGYYGRFGFRAETARGLQTPWSGPHLMAVELVPGGLAGGQGVARYPAAFGELPDE